eukprot:GILK01014848.1.p1 GENE.GILK01014848.1~~GILK01014848.1.p1  ORF type:complete len:288 (-),score=33.84 GILK01014848.1:116-868(-)
MENCRRVYDTSASYLKYRRILVDWMSEVGEEFELTDCTVHVAVSLLDRVLHQAVISRTRLQLVAMCCLVIAAKFEETESKVPSVKALQQCSNNAFSIELINQMEVYLLNVLEWQVKSVTSMHFISFFIGQGVVFTSDTCEDSPTGPGEKLVKYVRKYAEFFASICLQDYSFQRFRPSLLASACIVAARRAIRITPLFNAQLEKLFGYRLSQIEGCLQEIVNCYDTNYPNAIDTKKVSNTSPVSVKDVMDN